MINQKENNQFELTKEFKDLILTFRKEKIEEKRTEALPTVKADMSISGASYFYEKLRNFIDYKEEHLIRRSAIERILLRRLRLHPRTTDIGEGLIKELILAYYLHNNVVLYETVDEINIITDRYLKLYKRIGSTDFYNRQKLYQIMMALAAVEIEELLSLNASEEKLIGFTTDYLKKALNFEEGHFSNINPEIKKLYIETAVRKTFLKSDYYTIYLHLLRYSMPQWGNNQEEIIHQNAKQFLAASSGIENLLKDPVLYRLNKTVKKHIAPFMVLDAILKPTSAEDLVKLFENKISLQNKIVSIYKQWYIRTTGKLNASIVRAIIYIFITKMLLGLILEVPYDLLILGQVNYVPLTINALFPPILMYVATLDIQFPYDNLKILIKRVWGVVYSDNQKLIFDKVSLRSKASPLKTLFNIILSIIFLAIFGSLAFGLYKLGFNLMSGVIFFLFLSIITYFSFRLREPAKELIVTEYKEDLFTGFMQLLFLPFSSLGYWMSNRFAQINFFIFILDFLLEAPFKTFLEIFTQWRVFIKEKREELS